MFRAAGSLLLSVFISASAAAQQARPVASATARIQAPLIIDFDEVKNSKLPLPVNMDNKLVRNRRYSYIVDMAVYRRLTKDEKAFYEERLFNAFRAGGGEPRDIGKFRNAFDAIDELPAARFCILSHGCNLHVTDAHYTDYIGGLLPQTPLPRDWEIVNFSVVDSDFDYVNSFFPGMTLHPKGFEKFNTPEYRELFNYYIMGHEVGHGVFWLGQPGADYIGAATLLQYVLRKKPENIDKARELMEFQADRRLVDEIMRLGAFQQSDSGTYSSRAIRAVLELPHKVLINMTPAQIRENARSFDRAARGNLNLKLARPELRLYRAFDKYMNTKKDDPPLCVSNYHECEYRRSFMAFREFQSTRPFAPGRAEHQTLVDFMAALKRLSMHEAAAMLPASEISSRQELRY